MEFFAIADVAWDEADIKNHIRLDKLTEIHCDLHLIKKELSGGWFHSPWDEFYITLDQIKGGIRSFMPDCPNAFTWSITTGFPPAPDKIVIHGSINRTEHKPDFIESIKEFIEDFKDGIEAYSKEI